MHMLWALFKECNDEIKKKGDWKKILPSPSCSMAWSEEVEARLVLRLCSRSLGSKVGYGDFWDLGFLD